jgi:predicted nucleic acid-binding protein
MAAMARRQREDPMSGDDIDLARGRLIQNWNDLTIVEVSQSLVETAGRFADGFALRGYDSVQLAAAHELRKSTEQTLTFVSYDRRLRQAAQLLQLEVLL